MTCNVSWVSLSFFMVTPECRSHVTIAETASLQSSCGLARGRHPGGFHWGPAPALILISWLGVPSPWGQNKFRFHIWERLSFRFCFSAGQWGISMPASCSGQTSLTPLRFDGVFPARGEIRSQWLPFFGKHQFHISAWKCPRHIICCVLLCLLNPSRQLLESTFVFSNLP